MLKVLVHTDRGKVIFDRDLKFFHGFMSTMCNFESLKQRIREPSVCWHDCILVLWNSFSSISSTPLQKTLRMRYISKRKISNMDNSHLFLIFSGDISRAAVSLVIIAELLKSACIIGRMNLSSMVGIKTCRCRERSERHNFWKLQKIQHWDIQDHSQKTAILLTASQNRSFFCTLEIFYVCSTFWLESFGFDQLYWLIPLLKKRVLGGDQLYVCW